VCIHLCNKQETRLPANQRCTCYCLPDSSYLISVCISGSILASASRLSFGSVQDNPLPSSTTSTSIIHHGSSMSVICRILYQVANMIAAFNRPAQRAGTSTRPPFTFVHPNPSRRPKALANCAATSTAKCVTKATKESPNSKPTKTATTTNTASA
jgi:hypothetical protein